MTAEWYYVDGDETIGPAPIKDIVDRMAQSQGSPHLVWSPGMTEWVDAGTLTVFAFAFSAAEPTADTQAEELTPSLKPATPKSVALRQRARKELIEYFIICAYLYVCFGALIFYKTALLNSQGIEYAAFGIAIVKALILGKFILLLHALKIGERGRRPSTLAAAIVKKSLLFTLILIVMTIIEEVIAGYIHGRTSREVLHEMAGGTIPSEFAAGLLLLLIMAPYFGFRELAARLGEGELAKLLMARESANARL